MSDSLVEDIKEMLALAKKTERKQVATEAYDIAKKFGAPHDLLRQILYLGMDEPRTESQDDVQN
jgi:hypothetical protein